MKIQNWHLFLFLSNFAFFVMMVVFCFVTRFEADYELEDQLFLLAFRLGIILIVQVSCNLVIYAIPKLYPVFQKIQKNDKDN